MNLREKKKNDELQSSNGLLSCFMLSLMLFLVIVMMCWGLPLLRWSLNYIQWQSQGIKDYKIVLVASGSDIPAYLEHKQVDNIDEVQLKDDSVDIINLLFKDALSILIKPYCIVNYDSKYGFPNHVMCYKGSGVIVRHFEPIANK